MNKFILLSFDVEEFDLPEEFGQKISEKNKFSISLSGLKKIIKLLERLDIKATFFITANFALRNKAFIKKISKKHEIASHSFFHSSFSEEDLSKSKKVLEKIIEKKITGFRMPRLQKFSLKKLEELDYKYDSSLNPTYIPGRYNHLLKRRSPYHLNKLFIIPLSTLPIIRFPLFWLTFRNLPLSLFKLATKITLNMDSEFNIVFHPWEFENIGKFQIPWYIRTGYGNRLLKKLEKYLAWLKNQGNFITFSEFLSFLPLRKV